MAKGNFQKFIAKGEKGAKLKERIRQEKKQVRKETKEYFAQQKLKARGRFVPPAAEQRDSRAAKGEDDSARDGRFARKGAPSKGAAKFGDRGNDARKPTSPKHSGSFQDRREDADKRMSSRAAEVLPKSKRSAVPSPAKKDVAIAKKSVTTGKASPKTQEMPLNKYVAHAGICSRRDAADLVKNGKVSVNGQVITEPGYKVSVNDEIKFQGKKISASKNLIYILLNKPKDTITTMDDPEGRRTVMDIVKNVATERVYPVGRLDRNTTGVLLLTNDGELAQKLSHPSYEVRKIYEVRLDRPLAKKDFDELLNGVTLDDGFIAPDSLAYADTKDKSVIGIEIHSGKNRIVRRIFEKLGYDVRNLDRVMFANLTKKNIERGKFRFLQDKEIRLLKFMNASYAKKK